MGRAVRSRTYLLVLILVSSACGGSATPPTTFTSVTTSTHASTTTSGNHAVVTTTAGGPGSVERFGIVELTLPWEDSGYSNPWEQVQARAEFVGPSGERAEVAGFYYGAGEWRVRYSPAQMGTWTWTAQLSDGSRSQDFGGSLEVVASDRPGFVRSNPDNAMRWVFDDGTPYYPIGIGDCILGPEGESPLDNFGFDGEVRTDAYPEGWRTDMETYFTAYGQAGFNLFRWSVDNCAFGLYESIDPEGNVYLQEEGIYGDRLVQSLRDNGFRVYMVIFGFFPPFPDGSDDPEQMDAIRRYVDYVVARYGAYVDFWELMNESPNPPITIDDSYYIQLAGFVREADPYDHPISTSWQRPDLEVIDIDSPHWYQLENEFEADLALIEQLGHGGAESKPVIFGEQGNSEQNWDERSGLRMRIRSWTAFFKEVVLIFWNTSCCKDSRGGVASNIYLGPEEREYVAVLQSFVDGLDSRLAPAEIEVSDPSRVRGYALGAPGTVVAYLHAFTDHTSPTGGITVTIDSPVAGTVTWLSPATGEVLETASVGVGRQALPVPSFVTDVALIVAP